MVHDQKYAVEEKFILDHLAKTGDGLSFERGHCHLGKMLGFDAGNIETPGAPDPWWIVDESLCFIFEDYSEATNQSAVDVTKARQVASHPTWMRSMSTKYGLSPGALIVPILLTDAEFADRNAVPHLKDVLLWSTSDFLSWAHRGLETVRSIRRTFPGTADLAWRAEAASQLKSAKLDPEGLLNFLSSRPATKVLKVS